MPYTAASKKTNLALKIYNRSQSLVYTRLMLGYTLTNKSKWSCANFKIFNDAYKVVNISISTLIE